VCRFDPNFLVKRQSGLQEYIGTPCIPSYVRNTKTHVCHFDPERLLLVPGILEDRSLQHFLELEKHLDLQGDLALSGAAGSGRASNGGLLSTKSMVLNENDRLNAIVEHAAHTFIDVSEVPEPLEPDQAAQRKHEIVAAAETQFQEATFVDGFQTSVQALRLPPAPVARFTADNLIGRLEATSSLSYEQELELLQATLQGVDESLRLTIVPPSSELIALMAGAAALLGSGSFSNGSAAVTYSSGGEATMVN
jgi:hypothetical protein